MKLILKSFELILRLFYELVFNSLIKTVIKKNKINVSIFEQYFSSILRKKGNTSVLF